MQPLSTEDVALIAELARLELSPAEQDALRGDLEGILVHMDTLAELDTGDVEPMTHAVPLRLRLRADQPEPSLLQETALAQSPDEDGEHFRVPNVLGADT